MPSAQDIVSRLTEDELAVGERTLLLKQFADATGWVPSDRIESYPGTDHFANGHLVVEHGLANTAVISFLKPGIRYRNLPSDDRFQLLQLSYNNLVSWHFFPDVHGNTRVFNLTDPPQDAYFENTSSFDAWRPAAFEALIGRRPTPNVKALDDALIATVRHWKGCLAADLGPQVTNLNLSTLFNAILMLRAMEDCLIRPRRSRLLITVAHETADGPSFFPRVVETALARLNIQNGPELVTSKLVELGPVGNLPRDTFLSLFSDFYRSKGSPYEYDFSIITKHALSRIYESYVSLLRQKDSPQLTLFRDLPEEQFNKELGGVYTPQFIARFFARFLKENLTPPSFRALRSVDPACGSGIFIRTLLEMQCDVLQDIDLRATTDRAFRAFTAVDVDTNACDATRLSLHLLHLVLTGTTAPALDVIAREAIEYFQGPGAGSRFDAVVANPPFVKWDLMKPELRRRVHAFMAPYDSGKIDLFLAMLKVGMQIVRPGGYLLYVLPHTFLIARNAAQLRTIIAQEFVVRMLVDLSQIPVFESVGSYVILLILQRKVDGLDPVPNATVVRCRNMVGEALQDAIEGRHGSNDAYEVFEIEQQFFGSENWRVLPPNQLRITTRLQAFPLLEEIAEVKQGFVTGADDVFVVARKMVPAAERSLWIDYLSDREMVAYRTPPRTRDVVFHPTYGSSRLTLADIRRDYPWTYSHLMEHASRLRDRSSVRAKTVEWWAPERPRARQVLLQPKIVTPHLILKPRFGVDEDGKYAVSHGPFIVAPEMEGGVDRLFYIAAILNSSLGYWQLIRLSDKYSRGYAMLEPKTLRRVHIPRPEDVPSDVVLSLQSFVRKAIDHGEEAGSLTQLDELVAGVYRLTANEMDEIRMGT